MSPVNNMDESQNIQIGSRYFQYFGDAARETFQKYIVEYASRLRREVENVEKNEHVGDGFPEITSAHVEDARFITLRKMRRSSISIKWIIIIRLVQIFSAAVIGVGGSNFTSLWGSILCLGGVVLAAIFVVVEIFKNREY